MKKFLLITVVCIASLCMQNAFAQVTSVWNGTAIDTAWYHANPDAPEFTIYTANELAGLAKLVNTHETFEGKTIYVGNGIDQVIIDLNNKPWLKIGTGYLSKHFQGHFDGRDCTIKNLAANVTAWESYKGLFGSVISTASNGAIVENINVTGNVTSNHGTIGGIVGYAKGYSDTKKTIIRNCTFNGEVAGVSSVGGIAGRIDEYCEIYDCAVTGTIRALQNYAGGIVGIASITSGSPTVYSQITGCSNAAWVYAPESSGGITGYTNYTTVEYCNNGGCIFGSNTSTTGGIVGQKPNNNSRINYCISTGTANIGGSIVGSNNSTNVSYNYYDDQRSRIGGVYGSDLSNKAEGKHTSALTVTTDNVKPTELAGTEWTDHYDFIAGYYPIPKNISGKTAARLAALPIGLPESPVAYYNAPANFSLMVGYTYTSSNSAIVDVESNPATIGDEGVALITATSDEWSKVFLIENPYIGEPPVLTIGNLSELETFRNAVNNGINGSYEGVSAYNGFKGITIKITADIDMSSNNNWTPIGTYENPFCGTIDGQNHLLKDITVNRSNHNSGLFGVLNSAKVRNIKLTGTISSSQLHTGAFCGRTRGTSNDSVQIKNCHFYGTINSTNYYTGGLIGYAGAYCHIENCSVGGNVTSTSQHCGGMIGQDESLTTIENCINIAEIKAMNYAGGIIGYANNQTKIYNCLNAGNIYGTSENTGGIVAFIGNNGSQVINCINTGTVSSGGSIVGVKNNGYNPTFTNNYYDKQRSVIGGITNEDVIGSAEGKTTAEICALDASFSDKWNYVSGSYPTPKNVGCGASGDAVTNLVKIAAAKVTFNGTETYNEISSDFTLASGLTGWTSNNTRLISVSGTSARLTHLDPYGTVVLTATLSGLEGIEYQKKVLTSVLGVNPYDITNEADLIAFSTAVNSGLDGSYKGLMNMDGYCGKTFYLRDNITITASNWTPIGTSTNPFRGNFEGNNYTISDLNANHPSDSYVGLFGYIQSSCTSGGIKNLIVEGDIKGYQYVGGIVGLGKGLNSSTYFVIENCHFKGAVTASGSYSGGISGYIGVYSKAQYCTASGSITSTGSYVGGITGRSSGDGNSSFSTFCTCARDSVLNCANNAIVKGSSHVGGICGYNYMSEVRYCLNAGEVITSSGTATSIGGIVGTNDIYRGYVAQCLNVYGFNAKEGNIIGVDNDTITASCCPERGLTSNNNYYDLQMCALGLETASNGTGKLTSELVSANGTKPAGLSTFTDAKWQFKAGYYPIPIPDSYTIAQTPALLAATPVLLDVDIAAEFADTNTNQLTTRDFNVNVSDGQVWDVSDPSKITINGSTGAAHIENQFMRLTLTATIDDYSKQIYIANTSYVPPIAIRSQDDLKALRDAVNSGNSGMLEARVYDPEERTVTSETVQAYNINGYKGVDFYLTSDIDGLENKDWVPIGTALHPFKGNFHGQNKKITNLRTNTSYAGLFGYIEESSIDSLTIQGKAYINAPNGTITNDNKIIGSSYVGGLVGFAKKSNILQCHVAAIVYNSGSYTGGICGKAVATTIKECDFCGKVISNTDYAGGICGNATGEGATGTKIISCTNAASVSGSNYIGGIAGLCDNNSEIKFCNNGGNISATTENAGGICGTLNASSVTYCIATGGVNQGEPVVGSTEGDVTISNCYFDKQRCVLTNSRASVYDKYTSEMQSTALQTALGTAEWIYTTNLYPVPKKLNGQTGATLAVVPLTLDERGNPSNHQTYRLVSKNFNLVSISGGTWTAKCAEGTTYLRISSGTPTVTGTEKDCANIFLKYNDNYHIKTFFIQNPETLDPIPINSLAEFVKFRNAVNAGENGSYRGIVNEGGFTGKNFQLQTEINLSDTTAVNVKDDFLPIGSSSFPFKGNFDGDGHTISNLVINGNGSNNNTPTSYRALFGYALGSTIENLKVEGNVSGTSDVAGICSYIRGAEGSNYANIRNCTFIGTVESTSSRTGGICGNANYYTNIIACEVAGLIAGGANYSGGIVGYSVGTEEYRNYIDSCINIANVGGTSSVGGICGQDSYCDINHCINGGNISGANYSTGGIVGYNGGYISHCLSTGNTNMGGAITGYGTSCVNSFYDKTKTSVLGIANSSNVSSDPDGAATGLTPQQLVGTTPSGITGLKWTSTYWTFADDRYPVLKGRTSDIANLSAIPIYLNDPITSQSWNNVFDGFRLSSIPSGYTWNSSDPDYINVSDPNNVIVNGDAHEGEICNSILTVTKDGITKKYIISSQDPPTDLNINNLTDLINFRNAVNDRRDGKYKGVLNTNGFLGITFHITDDIEVGSEHWEAIGSTAATFFAGNLDGEDHTISNLNYTTPDSETKYFGGFIGKIFGGYIQNLTVEMRSAGTGVPNVTKENGYFGGICAFIEGVDNDKRKGIIANCSFVGDSIYQNTQNNGTGGICGNAAGYTEITNCTNSASITGRNNTGGIVGRMANTALSATYISNCSNEGNIGVASGGGTYFGGICGYYNTAGPMIDCNNTGNILGNAHSGGIVGCIAGYNATNPAIITNCTNNGNVESKVNDGAAGGIAGLANTYSVINKCVTNGEITGLKNYVGGVSGRSVSTAIDKENIIEYCANSGIVNSKNASSSNYIGGICGSAERTIIRYNNNGANVIGASATSVGGIVGDSDENSTIEYNIATGTVEKGGSICGKNKGTATNNLYDSQRSIAKGIGSADVEGSAEGKTTTQLTGSALTGATWTSNFVMNSNMYPMPKFTNTKTESIIASTPIFITSSPAVEIYDSVWNNFTVSTENGVAWSIVEEPANIEISGTTATITRICDNDVPQTLLVTKDGVSKKVNVTIAKFEVPEPGIEEPAAVCSGQTVELTVSSTNPTEPAYTSYTWEGAGLLSDNEATVGAMPLETTTYTVTVGNSNCTATTTISVTPSEGPSIDSPTADDFIWTGGTSGLWSDHNNWLQYDTENSKYVIASSYPNATNKNVFVEQYGDNCIQNWASTDRTIDINNIKIGENAFVTVPNETTLNISGKIESGDNATLTVNGKIVFNGDSEQILSGTGALSFNEVEFNNANGINAIGLTDPIKINGTATFANGIVHGNVYFDKTASYNTDGVNSSKFVDGEVTKVMVIDETFTFPVGTMISGSGQIAKFKATSSENTDLTVKYNTDNQDFAGMPDWWEHGGNMDGSSIHLDHVSDREYWIVGSSEATNLSAVQLFWVENANHSFDENSEGGTDDLDYLRLAYANEGGSVWTGLNTSYTGTLSTGSATTTDIIPFTNSRAEISKKIVTFASTKSRELLLPIELIEFKAKCNNNNVDLTWATASERNNDRFIIEKSLDAMNFTEIATIAGAGNSIEQIDYSLTDYDYYGGDVYYRLLQVDYDGTKTYSEIVSVKCSNWENDPNISVFPNPFSSELTIVLENFRNEPATIEIYDVMGRNIKQMQIDSPRNEYETTFNLDNIPAGIYNVRVRTSSSTLNRQIVKE